jgi:hypothetical protein
MKDWIERIDRLDTSLFNVIKSQTDDGERRSLLAVQRATARKYNKYAYLEIGSYLGGSIQPYLVDDRCERIYSIDVRASQTPNDSEPGYFSKYNNNSSETMLRLLRDIGYGNLDKIECFDSDASQIDIRRIETAPQITFIDGEHTESAVLSDYKFCNSIVSEKGTILFHDFYIIYPAIFKICKQLNKQEFAALKLEGSVFAIFFDRELINGDPYLLSLWKKRRAFLLYFRMKSWFKKYLPDPVQNLLRKLRAAITSTALPV